MTAAGRTGALRVLHAEPDRYGPDERAPVEAVASVDYAAVPDQQAFRTALAAAPYDAAFVRVGLAVGADELAACPSLRWIVTPTTGLDHLDLAVLGDRGVEVVSLRGEGALLRTVHATAEHTWGLLLALVRRTRPAVEAVLEGRWEREPFLGTELHGRTLGIVGCGRLGSMVGGYGRAFGMRVLVHDLDPRAADAVEGATAVGPEELLAEADVVSLHLPLDERTRGWLSRERLALVRPGAWLVNTARGELIDEDALLEVLATGRLAGAALDVVADDGRWSVAVPPGQRLVAYAREHREVLITPHIGGYATDSVRSTRRFVAERFADRVADPPAPPDPH